MPVGAQQGIRFLDAADELRPLSPQPSPLGSRRWSSSETASGESSASRAGSSAPVNLLDTVAVDLLVWQVSRAAERQGGSPRRNRSGRPAVGASGPSKKGRHTGFSAPNRNRTVTECNPCTCPESPGCWRQGARGALTSESSSDPPPDPAEPKASPGGVRCRVRIPVNHLIFTLNSARTPES